MSVFLRPEMDLHHEFYIPPSLSGLARAEYADLVSRGYEVWRGGSYDGAMALFDRAEAIRDAA